MDKETPLMIARHLCAYRFAKDFVFNKRVLDIGCGEGYGSNYLAGFANQVVGIDYDKEIIDYAKDKYKRGNLLFYSMDVKELGSFGDCFEAICAFQVIEHIGNTKKFLDDVRSILKDNGSFVCSTPNRQDASPYSEMPFNKFHIKEYLSDEFRESLRMHFKKVDMYGLKRGQELNFYRSLKKIGLCNFLPSSVNPVKRFYKRINCDNFIIGRDKVRIALDFIAVCIK